MKKALIISNIEIKFSNFIVPPAQVLTSLGYEVHACANISNFKEEKNKYNYIKIHHIDFERNPLNFRNIKAYRQLIRLMKEEKFDLIHCSTPIGGLLGRICSKQLKIKKVIYMVHGFHFYKGAPLINRIIYKNIEKFLAKYTDVLITINEEDYEATKKFKLRNGEQVYKVHGVGIDSKNFVIEDFNKIAYRKKLNLNKDDILLISAGDLINRKNYDIAIKAIAECKNKNIKYFICGEGPKEEELKQLISNLNLQEQVYLLGYRNDIKELMNSADIFLFTTLQEGLPRSMMEAMSTGLPCIASNIRGNVDLIENEKGGFLNNPNSPEDFAKSISILVNDKDLRRKMGEFNKEYVKQFDTENVKQELYNIYSNIRSKEE